MILEGFKKKSINKHLNSVLEKRCLKAIDNKIRTIGVIIYIDEMDDFELFKTFSEALHVKPKDVKIIAFTSDKKVDTYAWNRCFNPKDFGWKGKINNIDLQMFLDTEFDLLVSYYKADVLELKLLTALSKAKFKTSIFQLDRRLNDLIINTEIKTFGAFKTELNKYLSVLNILNKA